MSLTVDIPAPARVRVAPAQLMRCGGINCPPGTCDHTDDPDDATVHRSVDDTAVGIGEPVPGRVLRVLDTPGTPLDTSVRTSMGARLGHDFGHVRIHTDAEAARSAQSIGAHAYTFGSHVVIGAGRYQPHTPAGHRLLIHELTHVVQQSGVSGRPTAVSDPGDAAEQEADGVARRATQLLTSASTDRGLVVTAAPVEGGLIIARTEAVIPGKPGGPSGCEDLLQQIIELLNEIAQRFNDALNDPHDLFKYHRTVGDAHPDHGSWDGHENRYNYDRERLRTKLAEWEADDRCRGLPLSRQQQEDMQEAREFSKKNFPARPAPTLRKSAEGESPWEKLRRYLPEILVGALMAAITVAAAAALVACFASGACEVGAILAGAGILLIAGVRAAMEAAGIRDTSSGASVAADEESAEPTDAVA